MPYLRGLESSLPSPAVLTLCLTSQPPVQIPGCYTRQKTISLFIHVTDSTQYVSCTYEKYLTLTLPLSLPTTSCISLERTKKEKKKTNFLNSDKITNIQNFTIDYCLKNVNKLNLIEKV